MNFPKKTAQVRHFIKNMGGNKLKKNRFYKISLAIVFFILSLAITLQVRTMAKQDSNVTQLLRNDEFMKRYDSMYIISCIAFSLDEFKAHNGYESALNNKSLEEYYKNCNIINTAIIFLP